MLRATTYINYRIVVQKRLASDTDQLIPANHQTSCAGRQFLNCYNDGIALFWMIMAEKEDLSYVVRNRKARHDYAIQETLEAGIELKGSEVKSLRDGKTQMSDAYALVENGQVFLRNLNITPYKMSADPLDPTRPRRLLLHSKQIRRLAEETDQKGKTLVPLAIYFKGRLAKVELAIAVGRKKYDKREAIAKADSERRIRRAIRKDL